MDENPFERARAERALARALERLRIEEANAGRAGRFEQLKTHLTGDEPSAADRDLVEAWGVSEASVRVFAHRLRKRLGRFLREEIAATGVDR